MTFDPTKLTAAPWRFDENASILSIQDGDGDSVFWEDHESHHLKSQSDDDLPFIALARNAFDVMMRRKRWFTSPLGGGMWTVFTGEDRIGGGHTAYGYFGHDLKWPDPFTALIEADKWYAANVENKP